MSARPTTEAERLRRCRQVFELAVRDRVSMAVARDRLARERWAEADARLSAKNNTALCGTAAPAFAETDEDGDARLQWWQR
ncbi:hypothetical protein DFR49_2316 [Hephaestia caeni]|uniref:Uncharacterized protein n=1 Tax=Hephaestia caeni TaxID=645617 RepID=A0A397P7P3_9SPHN|nr:hypothetical protein [Hephaestia caeni]RIA44079.1 hypothetical protein DFR49_2316 [Hephaestia caeni]